MKRIASDSAQPGPDPAGGDSFIRNRGDKRFEDCDHESDSSVASDVDLERLVEACEDAFGLAGYNDEEDVMTPPSGITFGMIRRARAALEARRAPR